MTILKTSVPLRCVVQGPQDGEAVLMLHGLTDSAFSFSRVLPLLPDWMRVVVPDQRGHGDSERPDAGYELDDLAGDAIQLLDTLSIPRATVVGHSMGSFVARQVALRAPERVERLVLVGAGANGRNDVMVGLKQAVDGLSDPVDPAFAREFQESTVHRPVPAEFLEHAVGISAKVPARVWKAALAGLMNYAPVEADLRCPTLVLGGDRDAVFSRAEQEEVARRIAGAKLRIFSAIGHAPHWEDPEAFVEELTRFVKEH